MSAGPRVACVSGPISKQVPSPQPWHSGHSTSFCFCHETSSLYVWVSINSALLFLTLPGRQNGGPQRCPCCDPQSLSICYMMSQRDFISVTKDAETGSISGLSGWPNVITSVFVTRMQGVPSQRERELTSEAELRAMSLMPLPGEVQEPRPVVGARIWKMPPFP